MPSTRLETRAGWIGDRHEQLIAAVQRALVEGIRIPEQDRDIRILEYPAHAFAPPNGKGANYTIVEISLFTGRSVDAKRRLYAALVNELGAYGITPSDLKVVLHDVPRENWGLGGKAAVDIELGFKVEV
ncbi:4-oxalocrotonate tautomerase [Devosia insulae DS-56]|uniref:4-oxalocrotonate tautomerase n=1 Tax=Devosia insulae DS-56 TaxID=1116389 RepID=A0A1E5XJ16_9HYPH|nr:tautomerase family protein [Devosia insulae]OEO28577.1 4-oxalocrotonate tautomerase [Devosia insulae DS-56]